MRWGTDGSSGGVCGPGPSAAPFSGLSIDFVTGLATTISSDLLIVGLSMRGGSVVVGLANRPPMVTLRELGVDGVPDRTSVGNRTSNGGERPSEAAFKFMVAAIGASWEVAGDRSEAPTGPPAAAPSATTLPTTLAPTRPKRRSNQVTTASAENRSASVAAPDQPRSRTKVPIPITTSKYVATARTSTLSSQVVAAPKSDEDGRPSRAMAKSAPIESTNDAVPAPYWAIRRIGDRSLGPDGEGFKNAPIGQ